MFMPCIAVESSECLVAGWVKCFEIRPKYRFCFMWISHTTDIESPGLGSGTDYI